MICFSVSAAQLVTHRRFNTQCGRTQIRFRANNKSVFLSVIINKAYSKYQVCNILLNNFRLKDKEDRVGDTEESPNTSLSSMSPLSEREASPPRAAPAPSAQLQSGSALETARHLQGLSHRGYGAPVSSWNGTHSHLSRQVDFFNLNFDLRIDL